MIWCLTMSMWMTQLVQMRFLFLNQFSFVPHGIWYTMIEVCFEFNYIYYFWFHVEIFFDGDKLSYSHQQHTVCWWRKRPPIYVFSDKIISMAKPPMLEMKTIHLYMYLVPLITFQSWVCNRIPLKSKKSFILFNFNVKISEILIPP